jgi:hypothetical protein
VNAARLARCIVAVIACAVSGHLVFKLTSAVLHAAFTPMLGALDAWPDTIDKIVLLVSLLLGARVAFGIFRRLWPERTYQELESARQVEETREARRATAD